MIRKLTLSILLIAYFFSPTVNASLSADEERISLKRSVRPISSFEEEAKYRVAKQRSSLSQAVLKIIGSGVIFFCSNFFLEADFKERSVLADAAGQIGYIGAFGVMIDGIKDVLGILYSRITVTPDKRSFKLKRGRFVPCTRKDKEEASYQQWSKSTGLLQSLGNSVVLTYMVSFCAQTFQNEVLAKGLNPFSVYVDETGCSSYPIFCMPFVTTMLLGVNSALVVYNVREVLRFSHGSQEASGDIPLCGVLSGFAEVVAHKQMREAFQYMSVEYNPSLHALEMSSHLNWGPFLAAEFLQVHGHYQCGMALIQMGRNAYGYAMTYLDRRNRPYIVIDPEPFEEVPQASVKLPSPPKSLLTGSVAPLFSLEEGEDESSRPKQKVKRRGIARQAEDQEPEVQQENPPETLQDQQRRVGLQRVNDLRLRYPINVHEIMREMGILAEFLPSGRIEGITANVFKISWRPPEGRQVSLNFEVPHGKDSTVFRGNKRDWALNTLELGYLYGWDAARIAEYIAEYNRHNLLRIPQAMMFILGNRPQQRM